MKKEITVQAKTVADAVAQGAAELGAAVSDVTYEVLEEAKKGLFGIGAAPAKVLVTYTEEPDDIALTFVKNLIADMELEAEATVSMGAEGEKIISVSGKNAGVLIGHHGDTLDALQYLVNLAANRGEEDDAAYKKITVDVENYRGKREETLRQLANRMAQKVLKYKKSMTLEPMNPYERRIIHSEIQNIEGVSTNSIGAENNRRIVIYLTNEDGSAATPPDGRNPERSGSSERRRGGNGGRGRGGNGRGRNADKPDDASAEQTEGGEKSERPARRDGDRRPRNDRNRSRRPAPAAEEAASGSAEASVTVDPSEIVVTPVPSASEGTGADNVSTKKPYYMRPRNASTKAPAGMQRTYQKPVKKDSVESYFFDLENSTKGLRREKEEPSDIAKACGIYDDPVEEAPQGEDKKEE